tara:strand:+ start:1157 stop:1393 length:237 start_codon:yes stop_codon:yes gene_type:complete
VVVVLVEQPVHLLLADLVDHREWMVFRDQIVDQDMVEVAAVERIQDRSQTQREEEHQIMEEVHLEFNFLQHSEILRVV